MRRFHVLATSAILSDTKEQPAPSRAILFDSLFIISKRTRDAWSALHYNNNNNNNKNNKIVTRFPWFLVSKIPNAITINRSHFDRHDSAVIMTDVRCTFK